MVLELRREFFLTERTVFRFNFRVPAEDDNRPFFNVGGITLIAPEAFVEEWAKNDMLGEGVELGQQTPDGNIELLLAGNNAFMELALDPGASFPIGIAFNIDEQIDDELRRQPYHWDFEQIVPERPPFVPETVVGGQRFTIDLSKFSSATKFFSLEFSFSSSLNLRA